MSTLFDHIDRDTYIGHCWTPWSPVMEESDAG